VGFVPAVARMVAPSQVRCRTGGICQGQGTTVSLAGGALYQDQTPETACCEVPGLHELQELAAG